MSTEEQGRVDRGPVELDPVDRDPDQPEQREEPLRPSRLALVPRYIDQGYDPRSVERRRVWVEEKTGAPLTHVGRGSLDPRDFRGNIENPVGVAQMPLGVAGPLQVLGEHAQGTFYVPLATTEGALVRSYERGMAAITRAGGAQARVWIDRNRVSPLFDLGSIGTAREFARGVEQHAGEIRRIAERTTRHGRLEQISCLPVGRKVIVDFGFSTGDAQGMNMIVKAAEAACEWILEHVGAKSFQIFSGYNSEKRVSGALLRGGKGKKVTAGISLPSQLVRTLFRTTSEDMVRMWQHTVLGHLTAGAVGYNGHYANGLTAIFIATGQDVANVVNSSVGVTHFELEEDGGLFASVTLASLSVATVGGGTGIGTHRECLGLLGCAGAGHARKLAEIVAATLLAGELSMGAAIASGEFVAAHETYGRNRPPDPPAEPSTPR